MKRIRITSNALRPKHALIAVATMALLTSTGLASASAIANGPMRQKALVFSTTSDRSDAKPLNKAQISGNVYIAYVAQGVDVTFILDGQPIADATQLCNVEGRDFTESCIEKDRPYDFAGGSWTDGTALPFNVNSLKAGTHTVSALVKSDRTGKSKTVTATFTTGKAPTSTKPTPAPTAVAPATTKKPTPVTTKPTTSSSVKPSSTTQKPAASTPAATGDWPNKNNTGPNGDFKTAYTGSLNLSNVTIENKTIAGCITITGKNVVIKNSLITNCKGNRSVQTTNNGFATLDHVEINAAANDDAIAGGNIHLKAVHVYGANDGVKLDSNTTIEDSLIETTQRTGECHCDALQTMGSKNVIIRHNRIDGGNGNAAIQLGTEFGSHNDFLVENNWFSGGGYAINYANHTPSLGAKNSNVVFRDNIFSPDGGWNGGRSAMTHAAGLAGVTWTNNKYTDGQIINW